MKKRKSFLVIIAVLFLVIGIGYQQLDRLTKVRLHQKFAKWKYASEIKEQTPLAISFDYIPEGSARLLYTPDRPISDFYNYLLSDQSYPIVQDTENTIRYEGFGMFGKGYIYAVELEPDWYYLEIYLPT